MKFEAHNTNNDNDLYFREVLDEDDKPEQIPFMETVEATEYIKSLYEQGERPVVTVPVRYLDSLQKGLSPHATWDPDMSVIAGTFGRKPIHFHGIAHESEERVEVRVNCDIDKISPRLTGPQNKFQGVVLIKGPIKPENIEIAA